jgi:hypothetical protein
LACNTILRAGILCGIALASAACRPTPAPPYTSVTSSLREDACGPPPETIRADFAARDLGVQECPGAAGWRALLVSSDANSWLELRSPGVTWSSEEAVVYQERIGLFPGVDDTVPLEWRLDPEGAARAAMFVVSAEDEAVPGTRVRRTFVVRLGDRVCLLGRVESHEAALALADAATSCE